jgi:hypothetical protein
MSDKVGKGETLLKKAGAIEAQLEQDTSALQSIEGAMASGDLYLWMINTLNQFNSGKEITFLDFQRETVLDVGVIPKFPYKAALFPLKGTAHYHELGRFLADFENTFPFVRVQNLELTPSTRQAGAAGEDAESLNFKFEIVALIKPVGQ